MYRKVVAVWLSLVMVFGIIVIVDITMDFIPTVKGATLYVNETGSDGAYTKIQDAINASNNGDTVFVFSGSYYENVVVNKTINLTGEHRENTMINGSGIGDVIHVIVDFVNISELNVVGSGDDPYKSGIKLDNVQNCIVFSNNISLNNNTGIYLDSSLYNSILYNNISRNKNEGIYLSYSHNNIISENNITWNDDDGILIGNSIDNDITDNNIFYNYNGMYVISSSNINITGNNISSNYDTGLDLVDSSYTNVRNNVFSNNDDGIYHASSTNTNLTDNHFFESGVEINGWEVSHYNTHNFPTNNLINGRPLHYIKDSNGIDVDGVSVGQLIIANCIDISVSNLHISHTDLGIKVVFSSNILLMNNNITQSDWGIFVDYSSAINLIGNNVSFTEKPGIHLVRLSNSSIEENIISNCRNGLGVVLTHQNNIEKNRIYSCEYEGTDIYRSSDNYTSNIIHDNRYGFMIGESSYNNITGNLVFNNKYGIYGSSFSSNNSIYHNNIINNINQARDDTSNGNQWDDGYPSGGNFWSDYMGFDEYSGPNQDIPGKDGIGDINYSIDIDSVDNYPLMEPHEPLENFMVLKFGWNLISIPLTQEEENLTKILGTIDGYYNAVQWCDITDPVDPWKHNKIGKPFGNDLFELNETMSFWIHINQSGDTIFLYNGTQPTVNQTIQLHPGWNMVGYPSLSDHNRTVGLNNLEFGVDVDAIQWFDAATKTWHFMGLDDFFVPGRGYCVHSKVEVGWEVPL